MNNLRNEEKIINEYSLDNLFIASIKKGTVLIFEPHNYHLECLPGFSKYLIDLGFNVDILMMRVGVDYFQYFYPKENIRFFIYNNITQIINNSESLSSINKKYDYILLETANKFEKDLYNKLNLLTINNSIFIFHEIGYADKSFEKYYLQNRIWTLGNISKGLQVNPHFFGNINIKEKNKKTRFFLTSSFNRNYKPIIESVNKLQKENFNFEIIITGRSNIFSSENITKNISDKFIFKLKAKFSELYRLVKSSDFIIILLDPKSSYDNLFNRSRVTGSFQLSIGFLKPCIINKQYSKFYNLNHENSLIYDNLDLFNAMKKAILLNKFEYKKLQNKLKLNKNELYKISIENIKKFIKK